MELVPMMEQKGHNVVGVSQILPAEHNKPQSFAGKTSSCSSRASARYEVLLNSPKA